MGRAVTVFGPNVCVTTHAAGAKLSFTVTVRLNVPPARMSATDESPITAVVQLPVAALLNIHDEVIVVAPEYGAPVGVMVNCQ
ncbi:MAG: hypothetical protein UZ06_CHB003002070 [Chlorobi bacterium OLB6]|nr:MAG: hypothetical protein UZ06_CHB003002070 [Chlorobi bacterium OLB6]